MRNRFPQRDNQNGIDAIIPTSPIHITIIVNGSLTCSCLPSNVVIISVSYDLRLAPCMHKSKFFSTIVRGISIDITMKQSVGESTSIMINVNRYLTRVNRFPIPLHNLCAPHFGGKGKSDQKRSDSEINDEHSTSSGDTLWPERFPSDEMSR
jgi:hypothetical protein